MLNQLSLIKRPIFFMRYAFLFMALYSFNAIAAPDASEVLKQQQDLERFNNLPQAIPVAPKVETPLEESSKAVKVYVQSFKIVGDLKAVSEKTLQALILDLTDKELTFEQIQSAADRINQYYAGEGYFLAKAIIPKQELLDGVVIIQVNEGKLDSKKPYKINGQKLRLKESRVYSYIDQAIGSGLSQPLLERGLLNINDNPGVSATAAIEPGDDIGSSRVLLDVAEGPLLDGSVTADNFGSRLTGADRLTAALNLNNPTSYGDQLSVNAITAPGRVFNMAKIGYGVPIGSSGLRAGISYTYLYFELGEELKTDPASLGVARNWNLNLRYPLYRNALSAVYLTGTYDWKSSYNEAAGIMSGDKRVDVFGGNVTVEHADSFMGGGFSQIQVGLVRGRLDLSNYAQGLFDDQSVTGPKTNGDYDKATFQLLRIQRGTERLSFQFLGNAQISDKNLDGGEKITLGGPTGVRAYPGGEGSGDQGYKFNLDSKYVIASATKLGDIVGSLFLDYGWVQQNKDATNIVMTTPNTYSLAGWGVGVDAVSAGKFTLKLGWAKAIGNNPGLSAQGTNSDGKANMSRFWLMGNVSF